MSAFWLNLIGVFTTLSMLAFIGIWIWAWNARHRATFDDLARVPLIELDARNVSGEPTP
jgi:cytochrome c oxidase cbb3-type subunit 4